MRTTFTDTAATALPLLDEPAVAAAWTGQSALPGMTVGGLAAHLARAVVTVQAYLTAEPPSPDAEPVDAAGYLLAALPDPARDGDVNAQVLARAGAGGQGHRDAAGRLPRHSRGRTGGPRR